MLRAGLCARRNFTISAVESTSTEDIRDDWSKKKFKDIEMEIANAKAKQKSRRTRREQLIVSCHSNIMASLRADMEATTPIKLKAINDIYLKFEEAQHLQDTMCFTFDVMTGESTEYSIHQWLVQGKYVRHTLVLLGPPQLGKTPVATMLCSIIAQSEQDTQDPYFIKVSTIDGLKAGVPERLHQRGVPLLLDDLTPGERKGSRPCSTMEELKHLTNVQGSETVDARNSDLQLSEQQPRIITSNACSLAAWHRALPRDVRGMSPQERLGLSSDVKAIFKRCAFAFCTHVLVPDAGAKRQWQHKECDAAAKVARFLGS